MKEGDQTAAPFGAAAEASEAGLVVSAYGWGDAVIEPLAGGLINQTFVVKRDGPIAVLQQLHRVFDPIVNEDIDAVTAHVAARGVATPRVVRTLDGRLWVDRWRALTWIDGETVHKVPSPAWAEAGGALVGRWHRAVADLQHEYRFVRAGVHDTAAHFARLEAAGGDAEARTLALEVLSAAAELPALPDVPLRHCHGDLKISNLLFRDGRGEALVDLDTVQWGSIAFELGDALRSWCNPRGEDAGSVVFDRDVFAAAMRGYTSEVVLSDDERIAVVLGLETVCLELASRFALDVVNDSYFGWDPARFPSRRAHNLVRARGQLALGLLVRAARDSIL